MIELSSLVRMLIAFFTSDKAKNVTDSHQPRPSMLALVLGERAESRLPVHAVVGVVRTGLSHQAPSLLLTGPARAMWLTESFSS